MPKYSVYITEYITYKVVVESANADAAESVAELELFMCDENKKYEKYYSHHDTDFDVEQIEE